MLVANAPYVPTDEIAFMPTEARDHEHRVALDGGVDGHAIQARIAAACREWLSPGGRVIIETSVRQAPRTASLLQDAGLRTRILHDEDRDGTAVVGRVVTARGSRGASAARALLDQLGRPPRTEPRSTGRRRAWMPHTVSAA